MNLWYSMCAFASFTNIICSVGCYVSLLVSHDAIDDSRSNLRAIECQVYKGKLADGTLVAIRSLKMRKKHSSQTYTHHIETISKLRHSHLASALGHCFECCPDDSSVSIINLVFEFVPNGTLRGCISGTILCY